MAAAYGGPLGLARATVVANFVSSLDGIVALGDRGESGHLISADSEADRFVMGLLRSCVDAILIGAGTFRNDPGHLWTPGSIYPKGAALFDDNRHRLGLAAQPTLVVVTASGAIDPNHPALRDAIVATTSAGVSRLRGRVPATTRIVTFDPTAAPTASRERSPGAVAGETPSVTSDPMPVANVVAWLRAHGLSTLLTEGGPRLFASLLADKLVDQLFLTVSPVLFGRQGNDDRRSLVDGCDLAGSRLELLGARRHGSHLFLRYSLSPAPE
ncbi:MAG TPA: dihydrofolate reductase family protein [Polyangiaceae bacterium]|nr:dihydrofolate reductase family protein [Polyangiaceae bacterium]